jgi:replicative DNA helicase
LLDRPEKEGKTVFVHDNTPCLGKADIIISKNRNGPLVFQRVAFIGEYSDFGQLEQRYEEPPEKTQYTGNNEQSGF